MQDPMQAAMLDVIKRTIEVEHTFAKLRRLRQRGKRPLLPALLPALYRSPIDLSEGVSGKMSVVHRIVNGRVPIVGLRQAFLRGMRPVVGHVKNLRVHELIEDERGVWMTDGPEELEQIAATLHEHRPGGHVLVGGLGLGVLATVLRDHPFVESVTVIERSLDVIKLCRPTGGVQIVAADICEFLRSCRKEFDCFYLDTWQGTGESAWWTEVMPLRRIIANRWGKKPVWCWAEDIMRGQCEPAAVMQAGEHWYYRALPKGITERDVLRFFDNVGLPWWERKYGDAVDDATSG